MSIGLMLYDMAADEALQLAVAADEMGFDAIWVGEHMFSTDHTSVHPTDGRDHEHIRGNKIAPSMHLLDPWVTLGAMASRTTRVRLATGVVVLPLRHPLAVARHAATLHDFSQGRFVLGVGVGWLREEFDAVNVPFETRGAYADEALQILELARAGAPLAFHGKHFSFREVQLSPHPTPYPIIVGGNSKRALHRAAEYGDAWFCSGTPFFEDAVGLRDQLDAQRQALGRTGDFRYYIRVSELDRSIIERYAAAGLHDLVVWADTVWPKGEDLAERRATLEAAAHKYGLI